MGRRRIAASWVALAIAIAGADSAVRAQEPGLFETDDRQEQLPLTVDAAPALPAEAEPIPPAQADAPLLPDDDVDAAPPFRDEKLDPETHPAQAPAAAATPPAGGAVKEGFLISADRLTAGPQAVSLTVDVRAPRVMNLNKQSAFQIVVRNTGKAEAFDVVARDVLPDSLQFIGSTPEPAETGAALAWNLGNLSPGAERVIEVKVKATAVGSVDHAATVSMRAGSKARTRVQSPKLKVEQTASPARILKGQRARFEVAVSNTGDGPATNVVVTVKLGQGLNHVELGRDFHRVIPRIEPNTTERLQTLEFDTTGGGEQTLVVTAESPDVEPAPENTNVQSVVTVVEPMLELKIAGPPKRFTDSSASYTLTLTNTGTAPARTPKAAVLIPTGAQLTSVPDGTRWDRANRRLNWELPVLEPGESANLNFQVRLGGVGNYSFAAEAVAASIARVSAPSCVTHVEGIAEVHFEVNSKNRIIDVGQRTVYVIQMRNVGTKDAKNLTVNAKLSGNLKVLGTIGGDADGQALKEATHTMVKFPTINDLTAAAGGAERVLGIEVEAIGPGLASCNVTIKHDDLDDASIEHNAYTRVMSNDGGAAVTSNPAAAPK